MFVHAYISHFLIFGRHPSLVLHIAFEVKFSDMEYVNIEKFVDK